MQPLIWQWTHVCFNKIEGSLPSPTLDPTCIQCGLDLGCPLSLILLAAFMDSIIKGTAAMKTVSGLVTSGSDICRWRKSLVTFRVHWGGSQPSVTHLGWESALVSLRPWFLENAGILSAGRGWVFVSNREVQVSGCLVHEVMVELSGRWMTVFFDDKYICVCSQQCKQPLCATISILVVFYLFLGYTCASGELWAVHFLCRLFGIRRPSLWLVCAT